MILRLKGLLALLLICAMMLSGAIAAWAEEQTLEETLNSEASVAEDCAAALEAVKLALPEDSQEDECDAEALIADEAFSMDHAPEEADLEDVDDLYDLDDVDSLDDVDEEPAQLPMMNSTVVIFSEESFGYGSNCHHAGSTRESIIPMGSHYEWNDATHTHVIEKRLDTICDECGEIIRSEYINIQAQPESHTFLGGQCQFCHYTCAHAYDANGLCAICGYQCPHSIYVDGYCAACGQPVSNSDADDTEEIE